MLCSTWAIVVALVLGHVCIVGRCVVCGAACVGRVACSKADALAGKGQGEVGERYGTRTGYIDWLEVGQKMDGRIDR